jgi:flagellar biosynthetic protein FliR
MEESLARLLFWFFIMMRLTGMIFFNSIFGRTNIPTIFRVGFVLVLTYIVQGLIPMPVLGAASWIGISFLLVREIFIGFAFGFVVNCMLSVFITAGELLDLQMGMAMAKMYDPASNVSMPVLGSVFNAMFLLMFFLSNAHLTLIEMMVYSFNTIPLGTWTMNWELTVYAFMFFGTILTLAAKMALPLIVVQLLTEVGIGIIMKAIPQINVFVLNIEMKMLIGYFIIFMLMPVYGAFMDTILDTMLYNLNGTIQFFR